MQRGKEKSTKEEELIRVHQHIIQMGDFRFKSRRKIVARVGGKVVRERYKCRLQRVQEKEANDRKIREELMLNPNKTRQVRFLG